MLRGMIWILLGPMLFGIAGEIFGAVFVPEADGRPQKREDAVDPGWWLKLTLARIVLIATFAIAGSVGLVALLHGDVPACNPERRCHSLAGERVSV